MIFSEKLFFKLSKLRLATSEAGIPFEWYDPWDAVRSFLKVSSNNISSTTSYLAAAGWCV
jgi:hypothetical protein